MEKQRNSRDSQKTVVWHVRILTSQQPVAQHLFNHFVRLLQPFHVRGDGGPGQRQEILAELEKDKSSNLSSGKGSDTQPKVSTEIMTLEPCPPTPILCQ